MLSPLAVGGAATALVAGLAGAWSPCGFSVLDTIGSALGDARRWVLLTAVATFTLGALVGGVATFAGLALAGSLVGHGSSMVRDALGAILALAAAVADWRGLRIAPQIRRQVPERWRWVLPLPAACALYGMLLGLGFTTFVLAFAVWALAGVCAAAGSVTLGVAIGVGFGLGRALPIVWLAPALGSEPGQRRLERLALEPRLWLGLRRLAAIGLTLCAVALIGAAPTLAGATAKARPTTFAVGASDPSVAGSLAAWQAVGGGVLRTASSATMALPGALPALGGANVAWVQGSAVVVANSTTLSTQVSVPIPTDASVTAVAVSDSWLVIGELPGVGGAQLIAERLSGMNAPTTIASAGRAGEIGRPSIDGSDLVFAIGTARYSAIDEIDLDTAAKTVLRKTSRNYSLLNPSLANGSLLYERVGRCAQELLLAPATRDSHGTLLLRIPSAVIRDRGWQVGYTHAYNSASLCRNRPARRGGRMILGATALAGDTVYFSEAAKDGTDARILAIVGG